MCFVILTINLRVGTVRSANGIHITGQRGKAPLIGGPIDRDTTLLRQGAALKIVLQLAGRIQEMLRSN